MNINAINMNKHVELPIPNPQRLKFIFPAFEFDPIANKTFQSI